MIASLSPNELIERYVASYCAANKCDTHDAPTLRHERGWFVFSNGRGWVHGRVRRAKLIDMMGRLEQMAAEENVS